MKKIPKRRGIHSLRIGGTSVKVALLPDDSLLVLKSDSLYIADRSGDGEADTAYFSSLEGDKTLAIPLSDVPDGLRKEASELFRWTMEILFDSPFCASGDLI